MDNNFKLCAKMPNGEFYDIVLNSQFDCESAKVKVKNNGDAYKIVNNGFC